MGPENNSMCEINPKISVTKRQDDLAGTQSTSQKGLQGDDETYQ
jgi:hypothetical protein